MVDWPSKCDQCKNCGCAPASRPYGARGYCRRCYYLMNLRRKVEGWDQRKRDTLKHIPRKGWVPEAGPRELVTDGLSDDEFEVVRREAVGQLNAELRWLRARQNDRIGTPSGHDIEVKLSRLLRILRPKSEYPKHASYISLNFNKKQLRIIFNLLDDIEERLPWNGLNWLRIWQRVSDRQRAKALKGSDGVSGDQLSQ